MYLARIEEYFFKCRRQGTILSPNNWLIAERWEQMGIPIHIVCKGIKETCRKFRSTHQEGFERIDMLTYCEPRILELWKEYRHALLGAPETKGKKGSQGGADGHSLKDTILRRIEDIRKDLQKVGEGSGPWGELKARALMHLEWPNELEAIADECRQDAPINADLLERRLSAMDRAYAQALFRFLPEGEKDAWSREIEEELASYRKQMDEESYQETRTLGMESLMRERLQIRRISLYAT